MSRFQKAFLVLSFLPLVASAKTVFKPELVPNVITAEITELAPKGYVAQAITNHPYTDYLIALPGKVTTGDACTRFVGQEVKATKMGTKLKALAVVDPMVHACIQIVPAPQKATFNFTMKVVTGGFVPADRYHQENVEVEGLGLFEVTLDMHTNLVSVRPAPNFDV